MSEHSRKRGRKLRDGIDEEIHRNRSMIRRGLRYIRDQTFPKESIQSENKYGVLDIERIISAVTAREIQLLKERRLHEIRETKASIQTDEPTAIFGSPVSVRMMLCQLSVSNCVDNSFRQIFHTIRGRKDPANNCVSMTPECHILLGKACEQMILEITTRACIDAENSSSSKRITSTNILRSLPVCSRQFDENRVIGSFSFAQDALDRSSGLSPNPLDQISVLHK
jgi:hypothetical protein